jgi:hypothetical protein
LVAPNIGGAQHWWRPSLGAISIGGDKNILNKMLRVKTFCFIFAAKYIKRSLVEQKSGPGFKTISKRQK